MRIWLQKHVVEGRMPELDEWYRAHIEQVTYPGTEVVTHTLPAGAYDSQVPESHVTYGALAVHFNHYFARTAFQAEREGYDAWVIGAGQDPGLEAARTLATIPTLGYGSTTFHLCMRDSIRFGIVGFAQGLREPIVHNVRRYGAEGLMASYSVIPGGQPAILEAIGGSPEQFLEEFEIAAAGAAEAGAQVIVPAEGLPAEILWHSGVHEAGGIPVLDPLGILIKTAETEVRLRELGSLSRPVTGFFYARPGDEAVEQVESVFTGNEFGDGGDGSAGP